MMNQAQTFNGYPLRRAAQHQINVGNGRSQAITIGADFISRGIEFFLWYCHLS